MRILVLIRLLLSSSSSFG